MFMWVSCAWRFQAVYYLNLCFLDSRLWILIINVDQIFLSASVQKTELSADPGFNNQEIMIMHANM